MAKIKVLAILNQDSAKYEIKTKLTHESIAFLGFAKLDNNAVNKTMSYKPNAVVIINDGDEQKALTIASQIYIALPGCAIIIMSHTITLPFIERAMQAGVRKVLDIDSTQNALVESIKQGYVLEKTRNRNNETTTTEYASKVIAVFGAKGGVGKSTTASNLSVVLAKKGKRVALIDLDLQFGDINLFFDIAPKDTIAELVQEKQAMDIETIKSYMVLHSSTVNVLCAPQSPEMAEIIGEASIDKIIDTIRPYYDYIILDTPPYFNDTSIVAIENADVILMVIMLDIATLRNTKTSLDILDSLQIKDKVRLVINRDASGLIKTKDAQNILDYPIEHRISSDWKTAMSALNRGIPVVIDAPRSQMSKDYIALGNLIAGEKKSRKKNK